MVLKIVIQHTVVDLTRSFATAKCTARPSCLVGVLYDISQGENVLMANQLLLRNEPRKLPQSEITLNKGHRSV